MQGTDHGNRPPELRDSTSRSKSAVSASPEDFDGRTTQTTARPRNKPGRDGRGANSAGRELADRSHAAQGNVARKKRSVTGTKRTAGLSGQRAESPPKCEGRVAVTSGHRVHLAYYSGARARASPPRTWAEKDFRAGTSAEAGFMVRPAVCRRAPWPGRPGPGHPADRARRSCAGGRSAGFGHGLQRKSHLERTAGRSLKPARLSFLHGRGGTRRCCLQGC